MLDSLSLWLHETPLGETLLTMLISMLPVVELRLGLPYGIALAPADPRGVCRVARRQHDPCAVYHFICPPAVPMGAHTYSKA